MRTPPWAWRLAGGAALILGLAAAAAAGPAGAARAAIRPPCCRVLARPEVVGWGSNFEGELGNGTAGASPNLTPMVGLTSSVVQVAAGGGGSLMLTSDGHVWASGIIHLDPPENQSDVPVLLPGLTGITQVAASVDTDLALRSDGTVWAWGNNDNGQLGNGSVFGSSTPVQVTGLTGATQIAAGYGWALALRSDGTVWSWGDNSGGQLGDGTTSDSDVPVQVAGLSRVTRIAAGPQEGMAVALRGFTTQSTIYTWGDNSNGELGDGTRQDRAVPVPVAGISVPSVAGIAAGGGFAMVLGTDGTLWDWGANDNGQLGNGTTNVVIRPAEVRGLDSGITQIAAGGVFALALHADGTVWAWGNDGVGELGNGTTTGITVANPSPVQVTGLGGVTQISAGDLFGLAIRQAPVISRPGAAAAAGATGARS
jgi:alpha-tubulin suppressor-like RCC1 family protein